MTDLREFEPAELRTKLAAANGKIVALQAALEPFARAWSHKQRNIDTATTEKARRRREEREQGAFYTYWDEGHDRGELTGLHLRDACETLASTGAQGVSGCDPVAIAEAHGRDAVDVHACRAIMLTLERVLQRNDPTLLGASRRLVESFNDGGIVPILRAKRELEELLREPKQ